MIDLRRLGALDEAVELMQAGHRRLVEEPDRLLNRRRLGRVHHRILYWVRRSPGLSVGDLRRSLAVSKQALHRPLQQLLARGLVAAASDPGDTRVKRLRLGARGAALEARLSGCHRGRFDDVFRRAGPEAEAAWRRVMRLLGGGDGRPSRPAGRRQRRASKVGRGLPT